MTRRNDRRPYRRAAPSREPIPSLLVVCEGKASEPQYIEQFRVAVGSHLVQIIVVPGAGTPKAVVETAVERMRSARKLAKKRSDAFIAYDEVWCVFDVDEHPLLADALQQARDNGIRVALSNPCFELWLFLHFADQFAFVDRKSILRAVKTHCKDYDKNIDYAEFADRYDDAVARAVRLRRARISAGDERGNPSTDVDLLTERIREFGKRGR